MREKKTPIKKVRYGGICVSIWRDEQIGRQGQRFSIDSAVLDRSYKDEQGQWQRTHSLKANDIFKAIEALREAFRYMTKGEEDTEDPGEETEAEVEVEAVRSEKAA